MMFAYLNHNIYVFFFFGSHVFQQSVGNPLGTNFAPFLAELFLCSHEAEFIHRRVHEKRDH